MKSFMQMYNLLEATDAASMIKMFQAKKAGAQPAPKPAPAAPAAAPVPAKTLPDPVATTPAAPDADDEFDLFHNTPHDDFKKAQPPKIQKTFEDIDRLSND